MISCQVASLEIIFKFFEPFFRKDAHGAVSERNVFMAVPDRFLQLFQRSFFVAKPEIKIRVTPIRATLYSDIYTGFVGVQEILFQLIESTIHDLLVFYLFKPIQKTI